jgi:nucleotide-binding universal stress UspA family protein
MSTSATMPSSGILAAVDFGPSAGRTAEVAAGIARRRGARLTLLHVDRLPDVVAEKRIRTPADVWEALMLDRIVSSRHSLSEIARSLEGIEGELEVRIAIPPAEAYDGIIDSATRGGHALVVLGAHVSQELPRPSRASAAFEVAEHAPCPVLIVCETRARIGAAGFRRPLIAEPTGRSEDPLLSVATMVSDEHASVALASDGGADELLHRARGEGHDLVIASRRGSFGLMVAARLVESADVSVALVP